MKHVVVIDATPRKLAVDWWRWIVIALASTVLCSCSTLPDADPTTPLLQAVRLQPIHEPSARKTALAPVVMPDREHSQQTMLLQGTSVVVEDGPHDEPAEVNCCSPPPEAVPVECGPSIFPRDEYLCDGGDGDYLSAVGADGEGLEPSDTVAQFDSEFSRGHLVASNRVCVYAPRFAATRKVIRLRQDECYTRVGGLHEGTQVRADAQPTAPDDVIQDLAAQREVAETIDHELWEGTRGLLLDDTDVLAESSRREIPFENRDARMSREFEQQQGTLVQAHGVDAIVWTDIQAVELAIDGRPAHAVTNVGPPSDVYIYEVNRNPRLKLTKSISAPAAEPGEVVAITIHYQNIGDSPITNLKIADSLTTRLEFVPDSDRSSRRALFTVRDNPVGSSSLLWEIRETIEPGQQGDVQFRCRVR